MKAIALVTLAGVLLATAAEFDRAVAQTVDDCTGARCIVKITVVDDKIEVSPNELNVYANEVIVQFHLTSKDYEFVKPASQAIEFKKDSREGAANHFSQPFVGGPKRIIMFDFNQLHDGGEFYYTVRVRHSDGGEPIELDPMIRNR